MFQLQIAPPIVPNGPTGVTSTLDVNPDIISCDYSTIAPGGYGTLNVGFQRYMGTDGTEYGALPGHVDIVPFADVLLVYGSYHAFEGRIMAIDRNDCGQISNFTALGYGLAAIADDFIIAQSGGPNDTRKTSGVLLADVIREHAPLLTISADFVDPGIYHAKSEFSALFPADVINAVVREGGASIAGVTSNAGGISGDVDGGVWDYLVYEGRKIAFRPRLPPSGYPNDPPDYAIEFDNRVQWHEDYSKLVGKVVIRYTDLDGPGATTISPAIVDPAFVSKYGFLRGAVVEGGQMRANAAETFAQSFLATRANPAYAVRVLRTQRQGLRQPGGTDVDPWRVRAGQWIQIGDQPFLPIMQTQFDCSAQTLQLDCGEPLPHGSNLMRALHRVTNAVLKGINPTTGTRT